MSLSSEWRNPHTPLRKYFDSRFTETKSLRSDWQGAMAGHNVWWPYAPGVRPPPAIGMVFDYRIRLALGQQFERLKGWNGLRIATSTRVEAFSPTATALVDQWATGIRNGKFSTLDDRDRTTHLFILAWLEELFRAGPQINSPIYKVDSSDPSDLIEAVESMWVEDVQSMVDSLADVIKEWSRGEAVFGPSFIGSLLVGGADADLIAGRTLVEVKTTKSPSPDRRTFCQLAGYLLLDFIDGYEIESVGICSGRAGTYKSWDVDEYLSKLAGQNVSLKRAREELREVLAA